MKSLFSVSQQVQGTLQEFTRCRQPEQIVAVGSTILSTLVEGASSQATAWIELTQKIQQCYAELAGEPGDEKVGQAEKAISSQAVAAQDVSPKPIKVSTQTERSIEVSARGKAPEPAEAR